MFVCLCNQLKDSEITCVVAEGAESVCEAFKRLGCRPQCGMCVPYIREAVEMKGEVRG